MAYTKAEELKASLGLQDAEVAQLDQVTERFPMLISDYYLSLIDWNDPEDPIRKMAVPAIEELQHGGSFDTSGEAQNTLIPGLQHKYRETALILTTDQCAMYCRHCFRKRLVGLSSQEVAKHWNEIFGYIRTHQEISNVILSGGDALVNRNADIQRYLDELSGMEHIDLIRIATRTPVTLPARISEDAELLGILAHYGKSKQIYVITQFNHPNEVTDASRAAVSALTAAGCIVRNQMVLLRGINDDAATITALFRCLTQMGCTPYYVFQCRPVTGIKNHFQVPLRKGLAIIEAAKARQNGLAKAFKYCMSHPAGKLEILGMDAREHMLFKFHEAKNPDHCGRLMAVALPEHAGWLPDALDAWISA